MEARNDSTNCDDAFRYNDIGCRKRNSDQQTLTRYPSARLTQCPVDGFGGGIYAFIPNSSIRVSNRCF